MGGNSLAYYFWIALGIIVALVMPLTAVVTAMSVHVVAEDSVPLLMLIILAIISFAAHVLILFGGRLAHASKTYFYFASKHGNRTAALATSQQNVGRRLKHLEDGFIPYVHHWRKHNSMYTYVLAGPFDNEVAELLRAHFPYLNKDEAPGKGPHAT